MGKPLNEHFIFLESLRADNTLKWQLCMNYKYVSFSDIVIKIFLVKGFNFHVQNFLYQLIWAA